MHFYVISTFLTYDINMLQNINVSLSGFYNVQINALSCSQTQLRYAWKSKTKKLEIIENNCSCHDCLEHSEHMDDLLYSHHWNP